MSNKKTKIKGERFEKTPFGALKALAAIEEVGTKRLPKEAILKANRKNLYLKELLNWAYSDAKFYVYPSYIDDVVAEKKIRPPYDGTGKQNFDNFTQMLSNLSNRRITGGDAQNLVDKFFKNPKLFKKEALWYGRVMFHDLKFGVARTSVRKIWSHLGYTKAFVGSGKPVFKGCQLAEDLTDKDAKKPNVFRKNLIKYPTWGEVKKDGLRIVFVVDGGVCLGFTRTGKVFEGFTRFATDIAKKVDNIVVDVEGFYKNYNETMSLIRRKHFTEAQIYEITNKAVLWVIDTIPLKDYYENGGTDLPLKKRLRLRKKIVAKIGHPRIKRMPGKMLRSWKGVWKYYKAKLKENEEGLVIKYLKGDYKPKRSRNWLKVKPSKVKSFVVEGFEPGRGKPHLGPHLGAFVAREWDSEKGKPIGKTFNVGGSYKKSLTDEKRVFYWKKRKRFLGKVGDYIEQEEKLGNRVTMYPRLVSWREDLSS